jgi:hypothetical protein
MSEDIKWSFWNPDHGKDKDGNIYLRAGHWRTPLMAWVRIIIVCFALYLIALIFNSL